MWPLSLERLCVILDPKSTIKCLVDSSQYQPKYKFIKDFKACCVICAPHPPRAVNQPVDPKPTRKKAGSGWVFSTRQPANLNFFRSGPGWVVGLAGRPANPPII